MTDEYIMKTIDDLSKRENVSKIDALERLLNWCAYKLGIKGAVSRLKIDTSDWLKETFDMEVLTSGNRDIFGEALEQITIKDQLDIVIEPYSSSMIRSAECDVATEPFINVFVENINTGRIAMNLFERHSNRVIIYGYEENLLLYRIAILNAELYNIPLFLLNADVPADSKSGCWEFANFWVPVNPSRIATNN